MEYRGVMHVHSTHSYDGKLTLTQLKDFLIANGISFCCMTEHTDHMTPVQARAFVEECRALSDASFLFIPGFEVPYKYAHLLFVGTHQFISAYANERQLSAWNDVASLCILAHPVRNRFKVDAPMERVIDGIEVWNQQYEGKRAPRNRSLHLFRNLHERRPSLIATGGLDLHRKEHFGSPILHLQMDVLSEAHVIETLRSGSYWFGTAHTRLSGSGRVEKGWGALMSINSALSICLITLGKGANALFARVGIALPRSIRKRIRSLV